MLWTGQNKILSCFKANTPESADEHLHLNQLLHCFHTDSWNLPAVKILVDFWLIRVFLALIFLDKLLSFFSNFLLLNFRLGISMYFCFFFYCYLLLLGFPLFQIYWILIISFEYFFFMEMFFYCLRGRLMLLKLLFLYLMVLWFLWRLLFLFFGAK